MVVARVNNGAYKNLMVTVNIISCAFGDLRSPYLTQNDEIKDHYKIVVSFCSNYTGYRTIILTSRRGSSYYPCDSYYNTVTIIPREYYNLNRGN